jgi:predicted transcriptional regulator
MRVSIISLRLPDELEAKLEEEARLTSRPRSEVARDAISEYLARAERERFLARLEAAARNLASDPETRSEALAVAEGFLPLENEALALGEPSSRYRAAPVAKRRKKGKR